MIQLYNGLAIPVIFLHCGNPSSLIYTGNNSSHLFIISPPPTNPILTPPPLPLGFPCVYNPGVSSKFSVPSPLYR